MDHLLSESPSVERMKNKLQRWYVLRNVKLFSEKCFSYQGLNMELKVKNLASSDSRGCDLQKEVTVKVTHQKDSSGEAAPGGWCATPQGASEEVS